MVSIRSLASQSVALKPVLNEIHGFGSLELGHHVASSVNSGEGKTVSLLNVATELAVGQVVGSVRLQNIPTELSNPFLRAKG